ncbi:ATP-dependent DNA helicase RecG [bacterium]|nr:ATP-dependent DNA helicase RecG [bacterium]
MKLELIPKLGPKTINLLKKININTVEDLVTFYPFRYNLIKISNINDIKENELCYVKVKIISEPKIVYYKRNLNKLEFMVESNNCIFKVIIFNRFFLKKDLQVSKDILVMGKYDKRRKIFVANDISFDFTEKIEPVYHLTEGLKNKVLTDFIKSGLEIANINDNIPPYLSGKYNFIDKKSSLQKIHFPESIKDIKDSKLRLIYEELFEYMFKVNYLKKQNKVTTKIRKEFDINLINDFMANLNFKLTEDQENAINEILDEMKSEKRMNRIIIGDVGSGKTIVAIIAMLASFFSNYQSAYMVPTEILAKQHFNSIKEYFKLYNINVDIITGALSKKEKEKKYLELKEGKINVIIGTHALLNENIEFNNLGLIITDEQHRFGVMQRKKIQEKGNYNNTDVLYLSATPIPRTYALTLYGDLDISQIKSKPSIRKKVITKVYEEKEIKIVLMQMLKELKSNHQIFVVSPLIETNEENEINSVMKLKEKLSKAFKENVRIEILHGKLSNEKKDKLMEEFIANKINILLSTTVIEVGVDVANATMMIIFDAERFGLATLHQLRGRVGRSDLQSYCYLIGNKNNARLKVMESSDDGFYISEMDFKQRGEGDLFGTKQSGETTFKIANIKRDIKILLQANIDSQEFIKQKLYKEYTYYTNLIDELNFLN